MPEEPVSFITAVNDDVLLQKNLLASPAFCKERNAEIIVQKNYSSAGRAYNEGLVKATGDILVFVHQDVWLPEDWISRLRVVISDLELNRIRWGVLGCWGCKSDGSRAGYCNTSGEVFGSPRPNMPVQSLDEIVLVMRKSSRLRFDNQMPYFHLYGTDICFIAKEEGFLNYAISDYCVHNTRGYLRYPKEFWTCVEYIRKKWKRELPIVTPCTRIYAERRRNLEIRIKAELGGLKKRVKEYRRVSRMVD